MIVLVVLIILIFIIIIIVFALTITIKSFGEKLRNGQYQPTWIHAAVATVENGQILRCAKRKSSGS